jgi:hypothetical protein
MSFRAATFRIPNAATPALQVRDIDKVLAKVTASGASIVTVGAAPDGFLVRVAIRSALRRERDRRYYWRVGAVFDRGFREDGRFSARRDRIQRAADGRVRDEPRGSEPHRPARSAMAHRAWKCPGTTLDFGLIEYSGVPRAKVGAGAEDLWSPAFTMGGARY